MIISGERRITRQQPGRMCKGDVQGCGGFGAHTARPAVAQPDDPTPMVDDPDDTRCGMRTSPIG